jgi:hypothetical protein
VPQIWNRTTPFFAFPGADSDEISFFLTLAKLIFPALPCSPCLIKQFNEGGRLMVGGLALLWWGLKHLLQAR